MASDRQRAKQRRRRAAQSGRGSSAGARARDIGLDDATVDESGLTDTSPAPDPLKNATPDVDQARAAETGAGRGPAGEVDLGGDDARAGDVDELDGLAADDPRGDVDDIGADEIFADDDFERAPDEVQEPAAVAARRGRRGAEHAPEGTGARGAAQHEGGNRVVAFLRACIEELRRVQWPDRRHVFQATAVVLGFVLVAGGWLGLMDALWQPLINAIL